MSGPVHPLDALGERYGDRGALLILLAVTVAPIFALPTVAVPVWLGLGVVAYATSNGLDPTEPDETEVERVTRLYSTGRISMEEHEMRMDHLLDQERQRLRSLAEQVHGVGSETSALLAREFHSVDALKRATVEDLREIHGLDKALAERIATRIGESSDVATTETGSLSTDRDPLAEPGGQA